jgi:heavy metal sensor kinase
MTRRSIRARLTAWYVAVFALATIVLAVGSFWLIRRSLIGAADTTLAAHIAGARGLVEGMERTLTREEMQDEFREFTALTLGEALLEVTGESGAVLCRPALQGWTAMAAEHPATGSSAATGLTDRRLQGKPVRVADATPIIGGHTFHIVAALPMEATSEALARFRWLLLGLAPAVVFAAGLGGYWISGRALAPVDRMTRAARAITVHNLDRRLDVPAADDELRRLAVTFNDMLARLQTAVADMGRFTAEASHELRTPVTLVRATAEVALGRDRSAADYREALAEVLDQGERMSVLVDDLLTLARADAGVEPRDTAILDLREVAAEAARSVQAAMAQRSLRFDVDLPAAPVPLAGSAESVRRLVLILLDNALKYTKPGGAVRLRVAPAAPGATDREATIEVTDTGQGLDPRDVPHVFDRFFRGASARQAAEGSGLGLAIAKAIVLRHGGTITVGSGPDGTGCRVSVTFPSG